MASVNGHKPTGSGLEDQKVETESKAAELEEKPEDQPEHDSPDQQATVAKDDSQTEKSASDIVAEPSTDPAPSNNGGASGQTTDGSQAQTKGHTTYKLLDEVLDTKVAISPSGRAYRHPMLVDCALALGLLVAMGGFTIGMIKIYITHSAEQSITQRNYKAAIAILRGLPLPGFFMVYGKDPEELLNQALYLDAMDKLDANFEDQSALDELQKISAGSRFFDLAQQMIKDRSKPSPMKFEGSLQHEASPNDRVIEDKNILPEPEGKD